MPQQCDESGRTKASPRDDGAQLHCGQVVDSCCHAVSQRNDNRDGFRTSHRREALPGGHRALQERHRLLPVAGTGAKITGHYL